MIRALLAGVVLVVAALSLGGPARAALPVDEAALASGPNCVERVAIPRFDNVYATAWSPDGWRLAIVRYERVPSTEHVNGFKEVEVLETLDLRTGKVRFFGEGTRVQWSASGRYLSYWGPEADYLLVDDGDHIVAFLTPSMPEYRWNGDTLVYVEGSTMRSWAGEPGTIRKFDFKEIPHYPVDDMYWSGDGTRFTLAKYDAERPEPERFLGRTHAGSLEPLSVTGALHTEWAPQGATLLVRYPTKIELRDPAGPVLATIGIPRGAVHQWGPGGSSLLVRSATSAGTAVDAFEDVRVAWPSESAMVLPQLWLPRGFSPDGRYYSGTVRTDLHEQRLVIYRCRLVRPEPKADPDGAALTAKLEAATGRLMRPAQGVISQFMERGHTGIDIGAPFGSPIVAADDGIVRAAGWIRGGGFRVCVGHATGLETCYFHTAGPLVGLGERVRRGQAIALVGMSGLTRGPHVHWEAKLLGRVVDPLQR